MNGKKTVNDHSKNSGTNKANSAVAPNPSRSSSISCPPTITLGDFLSVVPKSGKKKQKGEKKSNVEPSKASQIFNGPDNDALIGQIGIEIAARPPPPPPSLAKIMLEQQQQAEGREGKSKNKPKNCLCSAEHIFFAKQQLSPTDARLVCYNDSNGNGGRQTRRVIFPVHKHVLASRSTFFAMAFERVEFIEGATGTVPVEQFPAEVIRSLLAYIYSGGDDQRTLGMLGRLDTEELLALCQAAHFYDVQGLTTICARLLGQKATVGVGNACQLLSIGDLYGIHGLKMKAVNFIGNNRELVPDPRNGWSVLSSDSWRQLRASTLDDLKRLVIAAGPNHRHQPTKSEKEEEKDEEKVCPFCQSF